jgi:hypothetical protein
MVTLLLFRQRVTVKFATSVNSKPGNLFTQIWNVISIFSWDCCLIKKCCSSRQRIFSSSTGPRWIPPQLRGRTLQTDSGTWPSNKNRKDNRGNIFENMITLFCCRCTYLVSPQLKKQRPFPLSKSFFSLAGGEGGAGEGWSNIWRRK